MEQTNISYHEKTDSDNNWVKSVVSKEWGSTKIVSKDKVYETATLPGFIANRTINRWGLSYTP